jgi:large subunit ribosomal protein L2
MGIKQFNPTSPGRRQGTEFDWSDLTTRTPEPSLLEPLRKSGGRNHHGHTTSRFRGGGHKRRYRKIDFKRDKDGVAAVVKTVEYDPNRSCRISLVQYEDGEKRYILTPKDLKVGAKIVSGPRVEPNVGNAMELRAIPTGLIIHNVELKPGRGGQLARSAGCSVQLMAKEGDYADVTLPSGEMRKIHLSCRATIGEIGNADHQNITVGKAGRTRWMGRRPHNRGTSMNPVSHPMGGGEGRTGGGRHPCGPTGVLSKGGKTRRPRSPSNQFIIRRRKRKKK